MRYLTLEQVVRLSERESETPGLIRDRAMLESAVAQPRQSAGGADAYPDVFTKAAALMRSIAQNQPFMNGNKRTAFLAGYTFLALNGWFLEADDVSIVHLLIDVAIQHYDISQIAEHLKKWATPVPDLDDEDQR